MWICWSTRFEFWFELWVLICVLRFEICVLFCVFIFELGVRKFGRSTSFEFWLVFSDLSFDLCLRFVFSDFSVQSSSPFSVQTKAINFCSNDSLQFTNDCHLTSGKWLPLDLQCLPRSDFHWFANANDDPRSNFHHVSINMPSMPARYKLDTVEQNSCVTPSSARRRGNVHWGLRHTFSLSMIRGNFFKFEATFLIHSMQIWGMPCVAFGPR